MQIGAMSGRILIVCERSRLHCGVVVFRCVIRNLDEKPFGCHLRLFGVRVNGNNGGRLGAIFGLLRVPSVSERAPCVTGAAEWLMYSRYLTF